VSQGKDASQGLAPSPRPSLSQALCLLALASAVGCAPAPDEVRLKVYSWWSGVEGTPFDDVKTSFERTHPGIRVDNPADPNAPNQRDRVATELLAGASPSTFQVNIGADLLQWSKVTPLGEQSGNLLTSLTPRLQQTGINGQLPPDLLNALANPARPEQLLAVPLNVHQLNLVYFNRNRFKSKFKGRESFFSIDELCGTSPEPVDLQGEIVIGQDDDFSLLLLTLESVLPALTSATFYDRLLRGEVLETTGDSADDVRRAFKCVQHLSTFFKRDIDHVEWTDALDSVLAGNATFTVMGDWANAVFKGALDDGSVGMLPFPGSDSTFVFTSDTFPLPTKALHAPEAAEFLVYLAAAKTQTLFSDEKGSIPARLDAEIGAWLHGPRSAARARFADEKVTRVLATSGLFPPNYPRTELLARLRRMTARGAGESELNDAFSEFMAALPLLERWQQLLTGTAPAP